MRAYDCAICGRRVEFEGPLPARYPFCSERCRMVDFGNWLRGEYSIDRDLTSEDLAQYDDRPPQHER